VARTFDLAGITNTAGAPFLRVFCEEPPLSLSKGRESEVPVPSGFDLVSTTKSNSERSIATHPFGKLRAGSCKKRKDGAPSVGMVQCKDGPPAHDSDKNENIIFVLSG